MLPLVRIQLGVLYPYSFNITLRRKTTYYQRVFLAPGVMVGLLSPVLFLLPSDDTGKFPLGMITYVR